LLEAQLGGHFKGCCGGMHTMDNQKQVQNTPNSLDALGHASFQCEQMSNLFKRNLLILKLGKMILQSRDLKKDCHRRMLGSLGGLKFSCLSIRTLEFFNHFYLGLKNDEQFMWFLCLCFVLKGIEKGFT